MFWLDYLFNNFLKSSFDFPELESPLLEDEAPFVPFVCSLALTNFIGSSLEAGLAGTEILRGVNAEKDVKVYINIYQSECSICKN